jgi:nucleoside-diphosphate-sugar epimerase
VTAARRVLVTGAGGFIGRWSVPALLEAGFDVHAVVSASRRGELPAQLAGATVHRSDLLDRAAVDALVDAAAPSHLLHFAWVTQPGIYWHSADNVRWQHASEHLLRRFHAAGGVRVVMAGSCAEYDAGAGVCDEYASPLADDAAAGTPAYAACKLRLQRALAEFSAMHHLPCAWGRVFFQYGPFEHPDRLVPAVIRSLLRDQEALCSHGRQVRSFLHVADVGAAFAALVNARVTGPVNVGSDQPLAIAELIERIAGKIGRLGLVRLGARAAPSEAPLLVPVTRRLRDETAWRPRFSLEDGLADAIDWWRAELSRTTS